MIGALWAGTMVKRGDANAKTAYISMLCNSAITIWYTYSAERIPKPFDVDEAQVSVPTVPSTFDLTNATQGF